jgi:hypothetical protein
MEKYFYWKILQSENSYQLWTNFVSAQKGCYNKYLLK